MQKIEKIIKETKAKYKIKDDKFDFHFIMFLNNNSWFGLRHDYEKDECDDFDSNVQRRVELFCSFYNKEDSEKKEVLLAMLKKQLPDTLNKLNEFAKEKEVPDDYVSFIAESILEALSGELIYANDTEVEALVNFASKNLSITIFTVLAYFLAWVKDRYKTVYTKNYVVNSNLTRDTSAYDSNTYLKLLYYLFNEDYISSCDLYQEAAESKDCADCWLYLSLHFVSAARTTDLKRFPCPELPRDVTPDQILQDIYDEDFDDSIGDFVLNSMLEKIKVMDFRPNKTKHHNGIADIKLFVPTSCRDHFGKLVALAAAHYIKNGSRGNFIRPIYSYSQISSYLNEEIGELFLEADFRTISANKSYLQMIEEIGNEFVDENTYSIKGYMLAALARSHKSSFGDFAQTTMTYLKDAKTNGHTPEFVAKELFERGVLSFIPAMLLKMLDEENYNRLSFKEQTEAIKTLNLSSYEVEVICEVTENNLNRSGQLAKELYSNRKVIIEALHRIGNGNAVSRQDENLCLMTALGKKCPRSAGGCIGCEYEIFTSETLKAMLREQQRQFMIKTNTTDALVKSKCDYIQNKVILPAIGEMLYCMKKEYGDEAFKKLKRVTDEYIRSDI